MSVANVYLQQVLLRRGNTSSASSYTGPIGEVIIDTGFHTLRVQDGVTPGGHLLTSKLYVDMATANLNANIAHISSIGNVSINDQTMSGLNDGHPLIIDFPHTIIRQFGEIYGQLVANANIRSTATNEGTFIIEGGVGISGNVYLGVDDGGRLQVGGGGQLLPNVLAQFTSNINNYAQVNMQNLSHNPDSSSDFVATSDNGNDTTNFIDLGMASGQWDGTQENSLGDAVHANDGYLYVQGGTGGGNIIIGTASPDTGIKFIAGGVGATSLVAELNNTGLTLSGDLLPSANVTYNLGSLTQQWGNLYVSSDTIYIAGIPLRVDSGGNLTINGNSVGGGTLSGSQLFNGQFTATLDGEGHLIANQFIAAEGTDNGSGYSFANDGGYDTGMFSNGDGQIEFHNNAQQSAAVSNQGYWTFNNPVGINNMYNLNGLTVENADLEHGATAALIIPYNGATGEGSEVFVNNSYSDVVIGTGTGGSLPYNWRFSAVDGKLTLPNGGSIGVAGMGWQGFSSAPSYPITMQALDANNNPASGLTIDSTNAQLSVNGGTANWYFGSDGTLTFPGNPIIYSESEEMISEAHGGVLLAKTIGIAHVYDSTLEVSNDIVISANVQSTIKQWTFGADGKLTFPSGAQIEQYVYNGGDDVALFNPSGNTVVYSNHDSNSTVELRAKGVYDQSWTFNDKGLTFPDGSSQLTAYVHNNVNLDGGGASTVYEVESAYADGGFASIRSFSETFDGNSGNNYILDGGRA